jgi:hypothetical protein
VSQARLARPVPMVRSSTAGTLAGYIAGQRTADPRAHGTAPAQGPASNVESSPDDDLYAPFPTEQELRNKGVKETAIKNRARYGEVEPDDIGDADEVDADLRLDPLHVNPLLDEHPVIKPLIDVLHVNPLLEFETRPVVLFANGLGKLFEILAKAVDHEFETYWECQSPSCADKNDKLKARYQQLQRVTGAYAEDEPWDPDVAAAVARYKKDHASVDPSITVSRESARESFKFQDGDNVLGRQLGYLVVQSGFPDPGLLSTLDEKRRTLQAEGHAEQADAVVVDKVLAPHMRPSFLAIELSSWQKGVLDSYLAGLLEQLDPLR